MKITRVETVKFAPGNWAKVGPLLKKFEAKGRALGFPKPRIYSVISGGDVMQTAIFVSEFASLSAMEELGKKMFADDKMKALLEQWSEVVSSASVVLQKELSVEDLG